MSRPVLGGLLGKSPEWVKAIENGRLQPPRLPMLLRIAELLEVSSLGDLTGEHRLSNSSFSKSAHESLPDVRAALTDYAVGTEPVDVLTLGGRVSQAWELWHGARRHRTAVSVVLPSLLGDARTSARLLDGDDRRKANALLARTYHLVQLFLSFQPVPELIMLTGDRGMNAAMDADDPHAMASAAWYVNHVLRDAGQASEARVELAHQMSAALRPEERPGDRALWGLLQLACALSYARVGREGDAWRHWDEASRAADALGASYHHPWLIFGRGMVDAYAVTMHADLMQAGRAVTAADRLDFEGMPSATRRSFHLAETARAYSLKGEAVATVTLLNKAFEASPDTTRFSLFARSAVSQLSETGGSTVRHDAAALASKLGLVA